MRRSLPVLVLAGVALTACPSQPPAFVRAPTIAEMSGESGSCDTAPSRLEPMIVEWAGTSRADLQRRLGEGLVVVSFSGCSLRVLGSCTAPGSYAYGGLTRSTETWNIGSEAELYARLPVSAAALKADLSRTKGLDLSYALVGWYGAVLRPRLGKDDLSGECGQATHFVRRVQVGAFRLGAAGKGHAQVDAVFGGASVAGGESILRIGGDVAACTGGKARPEPGCDVPVQIQLESLEAGSAPPRVCGPGEELAVDSCVAMAHAAAPLCPTGTSWSGTACAGRVCPDGTVLAGDQCVQKQALTQVTCPSGTAWSGSACVGARVSVCPPGAVELDGACVRKIVISRVECPGGTSWSGTQCVGTADRACPPGLVLLPGRGCIDTEHEPTASRPAAVARPPVAATACPAEMAMLAAGEFEMGAPMGRGNPNELPVHRVAVGAFCIDRTETTAASYAACAAAGSCRPAGSAVSWPNLRASDQAFSAFCNGPRAGHEQHPANCVSWADAAAYCRWAGKRLPSEVEWEFAARGAAGRVFPWGDAAPDPLRANGCGVECAGALSSLTGDAVSPLYGSSDGFADTAPVGSFPAGASPEGVQDLAGNVWEWTSSWYGPYPEVASSGTDRVYRGGAWNYGDPSQLRGARRGHFDPDTVSHAIGFRCASGG
jgi:formylglycine-generating enzyme required for sulfatase activity